MIYLESLHSFQKQTYNKERLFESVLSLVCLAFLFVSFLPKIFSPTYVIIGFLVFLIFVFLTHFNSRVSFVIFPLLIHLIWIYSTNEYWNPTVIKINISITCGVLFYFSYHHQPHKLLDALNNRLFLVFLIIPFSIFISLFSTNYKQDPLFSYTDVILVAYCFISYFIFLSKGSKLLRFFIVLLLVFSVLLADSRSNFITIPLAVLIPMFLLYRKNARPLKVIAILLSLFLIIFLLWNILKNSGIAVIDRLSTTIDRYISGKDISNGRTLLTETAVNDFKENIWLGTGWQSFSYIHGIWASGNYAGAKPHNLYLQLLSENGILGTIVVSLPFLVLLLKDIRFAFKHNIKHKHSRLFAFSLSIELYFLFSSYFHMTSWEFTYLTAFYIALTISSSLRRLSKIEKSSTCI